MIFYKATEHLRQSKSSTDPADIEDHARESLRLFKKVPFLLVDESHGPNKLQGVCKEYMDLKFFPGSYFSLVASKLDEFGLEREY